MGHVNPHFAILAITLEAHHLGDGAECENNPVGSATITSIAVPFEFPEPGVTGNPYGVDDESPLNPLDQSVNPVVGFDDSADPRRAQPTGECPTGELQDKQCL